MKVETLLAKLRGSEIAVEDRRKPDGSGIIIASAVLPFPYVPKPVWGTLILSPGQEEVTRAQVEALLRHVWHGELDFFEGEAEDEE
jgi:hypothetical protein